MDSQKKYFTLVDLINDAASVKSRGIHFVEGNDKEVFYSYFEIYCKALQVACFLQTRGLKKGDELVFQLKDNKDFIVLLWASLLTGIIPVPLAMGVTEEQKSKLLNVWTILNNPYLIIARTDAGKIRLSLPEKHLLFTEDMYSVHGEARVHAPLENDIAFVQFSSGSTGAPKGVILTHKNLLTNVYAIHKGIHSPEGGDLFFSWMPLTHDMGLIGFHLTPLLKCWTHYIMPTDLFIRNPILWLKKVTKHKITFTSSPNFGYRYVLKHINKTENYDLDLSSLRVIVNGAEPISADLCREFTKKMSLYGMGKNVIFPVYGLAEASLAVSFSVINKEIVTFNASRKFLGISNGVVEATDSTDAVSIVEVGEAIENCFFKVTDNDGNILDERVIGNILIKGDNVTSGYYNNEKASQETITDDGWLRTGDLGFVKNDRLYITGRYKDILFINGQNYYSHDIERCAEQVDGIELGKLVATGFFDESLQREKVILFLLHKGETEAFIPRMVALKKHLNAALGFEVDEVIPVREIKKTTSGKLQRYLFVENYRNGHYLEIQKQIHALADAQYITGKEFSKPETEIEQKLWTIWQQILGHTDFGINEKFFELGGNSLKAAEMAAWVAKEWNVDLRFEVIFEKQTISLLSKEIIGLPKTGKKPLIKSEAKESYPLSASQKRLFYTWEMDRNSVGYNNPQALEIIGVLNYKDLEEAFHKMISRHEVLRTCFVLQNALPYQVVKENIEFSVQYSEVNKNALPLYLKNLVKPFTLNETPLFRASVIKTSENSTCLFLDFHHIIADGLSIYLFVEELFCFYRGEELPPLAAQYRDYVEGQIHSFDATTLSVQEKFWMKHLGNEPPLLNLPTDYIRPPVLNHKGEKRSIDIDQDLIEKLKSFGKENNFSLYMLLLGIYNIFLSKLTSKEDIVIGVPVAGRYQLEFERMLGMFVNNIAVRSYPAGSKTFKAFMQEVKQSCFETFENQEYEFGELIEKLGRTRDVSRNLVFDTMLIFQNMGFPSINCPELSVSRYFFDPGFSKYDLSLEIFEEKESLNFYIEYNTDLFKADTIERFAEHFKVLINNIVKNPEETICNLSILSAEEEFQYITQFNDTEYEYPSFPSIIDFFEKTVLLSPDAIAILHNESEVSYAGLKMGMDNLVGILIREGVKPGDIVGVMMEQSPELITAILAILKSGASFLPIDHELPDERINFLIADSRAALVLTKKRYQPKLNIVPQERLLFIDLLQWSGVQPLSSPSSIEVERDSLAYVIYTSGTTGKPKGVMVGQKALINYSCWAASTYFANEKIKIPLYTSISFDLTITSIFPPLISGNTIVIYNEDERHLAIEKIVQEDKVEVMKLTPSHLKILKTDTPVFKDHGRSSLKKFIVGGEDLSAQLAKEIYLKFNGAIEIYNEYGPTEATVGCMIYKFNPGYKYNKSVPIGIPVSNTYIYLLDRYYKPVAIGVEGTLYIGGQSLAKGYLFQEELTKEKYLPNPFKRGQKMYCTGDRARRLPDGNLEFIGRSDSQVKINGYRIELSEIEVQLKMHAGIDDAVVINRADEQNRNYLCAYLVGNNNALENSQVFREYLQNKLPAYMIPAYFIPVDKIPLTKNGKIEINELPLPSQMGQTGDGLPTNKIEQLLIEIWKEVLHVKKIGTHDNFFHCGGDSIKAVQVVSQLHRAGYHIGIKEMLRYQNIEQLAPYVCVHEKTYEQGKLSGTFGFTPIINWFFSQQFSNPHHYNQSVLLRFFKGVDKGIIERTFHKIIQQHDGLRINYNSTGNSLFYNEKHLKNKLTTGIEEIVASGLKEKETALREIGTNLKGSFNIENDLLLKTKIIVSNNEYYLLITAHHLVIDGVSWRILLEDLYAIYNSLSKGTEPAIVDKTASLIDWYNTINSLAKDEIMSLEKQYWTAVEKEMAQPESYGYPCGTVRNMRSVKFELCSDVVRIFGAQAFKRHNISIEIILLTALLKAYKNIYGLNRMVLEMEHHGRSLEEIDVSRTIGWFTSLFPVELVLTKQTIEEQVVSVREQVNSIRNNGIGYGLINHFINNRVPVPVNIRFNYLGQFEFEKFSDLFEVCDFETGPDIGNANHLTAGIDLLFMIQKGRLTGMVNYSSVTENQDSISSLISAVTENVAAIFRRLENSDNLRFTPSEFETADLSQDELDSLFD